MNISTNSKIVEIGGDNGDQENSTYLDVDGEEDILAEIQKNGEKDIDEEDENTDDSHSSADLGLKLAISKELSKRVSEFSNPFVNAILSGNVHILDYLLQRGLSCPLKNLNISYSLCAGYHMEDIAEAMLEMLHSAAKACMGDVEQEYPPCQGCRAELRKKLHSTRATHKMF